MFVFEGLAYDLGCRATYAPADRACRVYPAEALRYE